MATDPAQLRLDTSLRARARRTGMRFAETSRADRISRVVLSVLAVLVLIGAVLGLIAGSGLFGDRRADQPMLSPELHDNLEDFTRWIWWGVAVLSVIVVLLALRWLARMVVPAAPAKDFRYPANDSQEATVVSSTAVANIVDAELTALDGVSDAAVRLSPDGELIVAWARIETTADVNQIRRAAEDNILPRLRSALGREGLSLHLELRPTGAEADRVV